MTKSEGHAHIPKGLSAAQLQSNTNQWGGGGTPLFIIVALKEGIK